jgi:aspartate/methionine/tyrosine aminotransferase
MVAAFRERRDYVVERLKQIPGVKLAEPQVMNYLMCFSGLLCATASVCDSRVGWKTSFLHFLQQTCAVG